MTTNGRRPTGRRWGYVLLMVIPLTVTTGSTAPEGRWKLAGDGTCYLDRNDAGPDQCSGTPGRWKLGGNGTCYWDDDDSGPNQCAPPSYPAG
jgi:hypothetical protein